MSDPSFRDVASQLAWEASQPGGAAILRVAGEPGATSAESLIAAVDDLLDGSLAVLAVDMHDLAGLEEAGVAAFDQLDDRARRCGTTLRITANRPEVPCRSLLFPGSPRTTG